MSYELNLLNKLFKNKFGVSINPNNKWIKECISIMCLERKNRRYCFECKMELFFTDYILLNVRHITFNNDNLKYLIDIWINPIIQLYCCNCYIDMKHRDN